MRTTIEIDDPILKEVKSLGRKEGTSLGRTVSGLLADGLQARKDSGKQPKPRPPWITRAMTPRMNLEDKDAVYAAMERDASRRVGRRP